MNLVKPLILSPFLIPTLCSGYDFNLEYTIGGTAEFTSTSQGALIVDLDGDGLDIQSIPFNQLSEGTLLGDDNLVFSLTGQATSFGRSLFGFNGLNRRYDTSAYGNAIEEKWIAGTKIYLVWSTTAPQSGGEYFWFTNPNIAFSGSNIAFETPAAAATNTLVDVSSAQGGTTTSYSISGQNSFYNSGGTAHLTNSELTLTPSGNATFTVSSSTATYGRLETSNDLVTWVTAMHTPLSIGINNITIASELTENDKLFLRFSE